MRPAAGILLVTAALAAGCTDSFTVDAPYKDVWASSTAVLQQNGFEMVTAPDSKQMIPASDEGSGRAWFVGGEAAVEGDWKAPRVVSLRIDPVTPAGAARRRITVDVEKRDWVVMGKVPDSQMRSRIVWMLKQALLAPQSESDFKRE